jgi:hypothetical protein
MAWVNATDIFTLSQLIDETTTFGISVQDGFIVGNNAYVDNQDNSSLLNVGAALLSSFASVKAVKYQFTYWHERFAPGHGPFISSGSSIAFPSGTPLDIRTNVASFTGGTPTYKLAQEMAPAYGESGDKSNPFIGLAFGFARTTVPTHEAAIYTDFKMQLFFDIEPPVPSEPEPVVTKSDPVPTDNDNGKDFAMGNPGIVSAAFYCED